MVDLDLKIFWLINQWPHSVFFDWLMLWTSRLVAPFVLVFFVILFYKALRGLRDFREVVFLLLAFLVGFLLLVETTKLVVARPRPFLVISSTIVVGREETGYSFPSAHAFAIALLSVLVARKKDKFFSFFLPFSFLVGFSRIYLGAHYPSDVFVGLGLGFLYGLVINLVVDRFIEHRIFKILKFHVE